MKIAQLDGAESRDAGIVVCLLHHLVPQVALPAACGARIAGPTSSAASPTTSPQCIEVGDMSS